MAVRTGIDSNKAKAARPGFPWVLAVLSVLAFTVLISLGNWQMRRLAWKEDLLAKIETRINADPVPLEEVLALLDDGQDVEYVPVEASGAFVDGVEQHVLSTWKGASGWNVYAPLKLDDERILFVNRGFVPYDRKEAATRPEYAPKGPQEVTGLARMPLAAKPSFLVPENDLAANQFHWKDLSAMTVAAGLENKTVLPLFVDAGANAAPRELPVGGVTNIDLPNSHLQYAFTWYGLAAALAGVTGVFLWRRKLHA
jgi:surfeit locus 1 family protein